MSCACRPTLARQPPAGFGNAPPLGDLGLFEEAERLARIVKWTGVGVLALAGAVFVFKLADLVFGD